jgi:pimeloyl-ACP methyl ester carboxylesterase
VVAIDLAGHGDSGRDRAEWTMQAFGQDVAAVVRRLGPRRVVLIGHSMGGPVIVEAALLTPETTVGLVGADTWRSLGVTRTPEQVDEALATLRADFGPAAQARVGGMFIPASPPALVQQVVAGMTSVPPRIAIGALDYLYRNDAQLQSGLMALQIPKAAINSDYLPTDSDAARRHGIAVTLMSGTGHFVMMEDPATFNRLLGKVVSDWTRT